MRYLLLILLSTFFINSCKKTDKADSQENAEQKRKEDATYNNGITPGVGNVFFEEKLIPNSASQLIFKLSYNGDTLAAYGKINSNGQLQYINANVLSSKGNAELLVTELFPEVSKSRMYTILNNVKSNIVIEINHYSKTSLTTSLLDMDWATGKAKVLKSTFFVDNKATAGFSSFKLTGEGGDKVYNCLEPPPTSDVQKVVDDFLNYFACGGPAFDTHPALIGIKKVFSEYIESVNQNTQYVNDKEELESLKKQHSYLNDLFSKIKDKVGSFKFENTSLAGLLKSLEDKINKLQAQTKREVSLVPLSSLTDVDYDEFTDKEITIGFTLVDKATGIKYTTFPVFIDMIYTIPGTNTKVHESSKTQSLDNGLVIFKLDPTTIPNYQSLTSLKATYSFSGDDGFPNDSKDISLKFIKPKVVFASGSPLPSILKFGKDQTQRFKIVNEDGRAISVNYNDVDLIISNNKVGHTSFIGTDNFSISLTTNESTEQFTLLEVIWKQKKIATINASINMDSTAIYAASIVGNWRITSYAGGAVYYVQDKILAADGSVYIVRNSPVGGVEESFSPPKYQEGWSVVKDASGYHLAINGRVYEYVLKYPVTFIDGGFPPFPNYVYTKQ